MDAVKDFKDVDDLLNDLLKLRKKGSDFEDALLEDTADYLLGHLNQINRRLLVIGDRLDMIDEKKKPKKPKKK